MAPLRRTEIYRSLQRPTAPAHQVRSPRRMSVPGYWRALLPWRRRRGRRTRRGRRGCTLRAWFLPVSEAVRSSNQFGRRGGADHSAAYPSQAGIHPVPVNWGAGRELFISDLNHRLVSHAASRSCRTTTLPRRTPSPNNALSFAVSVAWQQCQYRSSADARSHRTRARPRRLLPHQVQPPHPQLDRRARGLLLDLPCFEHRDGPAPSGLEARPDQHACEWRGASIVYKGRHADVAP